MKCLLLNKVEEFKKSLKDKDIKLSDLINLDHDELVKKLEPFAGSNAKDVATLIEEKLILKNRMLGLQNAISKLTKSGKYSPESIAEAKKSLSDYRAAQQERIFSPKEHESFLGGLASKRLGVEVSREVAKKAGELYSNAEKLREVNPKLSGISDEYLEAKKTFNDYINSQKPINVGSSIAKNLAVIGRNNLLLNPSTPIKTSTGQIVNSVMDAVTRRLGFGRLQGLNPELSKQANQEAWETFQKTGLNTAGMESLDDSHSLGKGENFKLPEGTSGSKIAKAIGKVAEISNKVAITWEHQIPFTKFYQKTFFDMADLASSDMANGDKEKAAEIFKDACRIEPQTKEGAMLRHEAQAQAARITGTNETIVSRFSLATKNVLNKVFPKFPLGDFILPIAKIPASIIANGIDNAGGGVPVAIRDIFQGREKIQSEDLMTRYEGMAQFRNGVQRVMRIGGTIGTAFLIASQFKKQDFKSDQYGTHFVKIGNMWINTEYISAISPALSGAMMARSLKEESFTDEATHYVTGTLESLKATPGIDEAQRLINSLSNKNMAHGIEKYAKDFFNSRGEPVFIQNLMKDRPINRLFFGAHGAESTQDVNKDKLIAKEKAREARKEK